MRDASLQFCSAGAGKTSQVGKAPSALPSWGSRKSRSKPCRRRAAALDPNLQQLGVVQADLNTHGGHVHQIQQVQATQQAELNVDMPGPSSVGQDFAAQLPPAGLGATFEEIRQEDLDDSLFHESPEVLMDFDSAVEACGQQDAINLDFSADRQIFEAPLYWYGAQGTPAAEEVAATGAAAPNLQYDFDFDEALNVFL